MLCVRTVLKEEIEVSPRTRYEMFKYVFDLSNVPRSKNEGTGAGNNIDC
jgi:hypothetical protein